METKMECTCYNQFHSSLSKLTMLLNQWLLTPKPMETNHVITPKPWKLTRLPPSRWEVHCSEAVPETKLAAPNVPPLAGHGTEMAGVRLAVEMGRG